MRPDGGDIVRVEPDEGFRGDPAVIADRHRPQHQLEMLRHDESPLWHLARIAPTVREQELRNFLGGFHTRQAGHANV